MKPFIALLFCSLLAGSAKAVTYGSNCDVSVSLCDNAVNSAKIEDGVIVNADVSSSAAITLSKLSDEAWKSIDYSFTPAALKESVGVAQEVIAAPGAGKAIEVDSVLCELDVNTRTEMGSGTYDFRYASLGGGIVAQLTNAFMESEADSHFRAYGRDVLVTAVNQSIIGMGTAAMTAGNATMDCRIHYRIVTISDI